LDEFWHPFIDGFSTDQSNCPFFREGKAFRLTVKSQDRMIVSLTLKYGRSVHDQGLTAATSSSHHHITTSQRIIESQTVKRFTDGSLRQTVTT
jgi:hypothetical protein